MNLTKLTVTARKLHRFLVTIIIILGLIMSTTGTKMKYPELLPFYKAQDARELHNLASSFFGPVFIVMALTGLAMYLYPWLQKIVKPQNTPPQHN